MENINEKIKDALKYAEQGEDDKAIAVYEDVIAEDSLNVEALLGLGKMWQRKGEFKKAANYYYKVLLEADKDNKQAKASLDMINNILSFYNKDMYNP